jgi:hypothetical protein
MKLAEGAQAIIAARANGMKPADMVIVSLTGKPDTDNPAVLAQVGAEYDWRWIRNLEIGVYVNDDDDWSSMVKAMMLCRPKYLCVWNVPGNWGATVWLLPQDGDIGKPQAMWKWEIDFTLWLDFQNEDFAVGRVYKKDALCN